MSRRRPPFALWMVLGAFLLSSFARLPGAAPLPPAFRPTQAAEGAANLIFPQTIRLGVTGSTTCNPRAAYTVREIDFKEYVRHVLAVEWFPLQPGQELHPEAVRAGAVAVKMYAWFWISRGGKWQGADVLDSTCDQVYRPGFTRPITDQAVEETWDWLLLRQGELFQTSYKHDNVREECTPGICMNVVEAQFLALDGLTWQQILRHFYDGAEIVLYRPPATALPGLASQTAIPEATAPSLPAAAIPPQPQNSSPPLDEQTLPPQTIPEPALQPSPVTSLALQSVKDPALQIGAAAPWSRKLALWGGAFGAFGLSLGLTFLSILIWQDRRTKMSHRLKRLALVSLVSLIVLFILSAFAFAIFQPIKVLPRTRLAPGFSMIDQDGQRLTNEDLRGRLVLYNFSYTRCPAPCGGLDQTMRQVQDRLGEIDLGGLPVTLLTISIDPGFDTPQVLRAYAQSVGADPQIWRFATLPDEKLLKTVVGAGFEVYYAPNPQGGYTLSPVFVLVDGWGIIRGEYRYQTQTPDVERILRHIGVLAEEVQNSVGAARLAYEAAHLFLCYAP